MTTETGLRHRKKQQTRPRIAGTAIELSAERGSGCVAALEEQRSEKYRHALIAVVSLGVRAGQLGGTDAWLSSHLVSHA